MHFEPSTLTTNRSRAAKKLASDNDKKHWVGAPDLMKLANKGNSLFDSYLEQFTHQYNKDIKGLMTGFKTSVKTQNRDLAENTSRHSSRFMNHNSSYTYGESHRFSPVTNRSKLSNMLHFINSNDTTVRVDKEKGQDNQICIESDDDYDDDNFEAEDEPELNYEMKEKPVQKIAVVERPRTKSANRKREELDYTR